VINAVINNKNDVIRGISFARIRRPKHREDVWSEEQEPKDQCYNDWIVCFHVQKLRTPSFSRHGACVGFCGATEERIMIASFEHVDNGATRRSVAAGVYGAVLEERMIHKGDAVELLN
jgi:hypothetical protein